MAAHHETNEPILADIYAMHLHQTLFLTGILSVTRVPGGWLYRLLQQDDSFAVTFVPFHNEFQVVPDEPWGKNPNK